MAAKGHANLGIRGNTKKRIHKCVYTIYYNEKSNWNAYLLFLLNNFQEVSNQNAFSCFCVSKSVP